jgi:DNA-directed RNA polymerase subunit omega
MNAEFLRKALEKVENPHILVNMISRRVRQLNAGGRPLLRNTENLHAGDIALLEIIEGAMGFETPEVIKLIRPAAQSGRRPQGWTKTPAATPDKKAA